MNGKIFILTHLEKINFEYFNLYEPIQCGKENNINIDLGYLNDNTYNNISFLNNLYSELTGMYWVWKNYKNLDYVGFVHYRRYFLNDSSIKLLDKKTIENKLKKNDFLVPAPIHFSNTTGDEVYKIQEDHNDFDLQLLKYASKVSDDIFNNRIYSNQGGHYNNMFITSWEEFDIYMNYVFTILDKITKVYNDLSIGMRNRKFGYLAEFLLDFYLQTYNKSYEELSTYIRNQGIFNKNHPFYVQLIR